jgi:uncharacterized protein YcnI
MKAKTVAVLLAAGVLIPPASTQAHISLHPNTIPADAFATLNVRVPGEQEGAYVKKVDVLFPAGFTGVDYEGVPGWTVNVIESKLAAPIHQDGETIDTDVSHVVWTWTGPLGRVNDGQFINFPLSLAIPRNAAGQTLEFRTVQTYSNRQIVHWIDPSLTAEHPAPRINITPKGGAIEDLAGDEAGPIPSQSKVEYTPAVVKASGGTDTGLAIAALVIGGVALLVAAAAAASAKRRPSARD